MDISIILLFQNCKYIKKTLMQLQMQIQYNDEIKIVNDHSEKKYLDLLEEFLILKNVFLINSDTFGCRSHNRNLGAQNASNDVLLFLDGDILIYPNAINTLKERMVSFDYAAIAGSIEGMEFTEEHLSLIGKDYAYYLEKDLFQLHNDWFLHDFRKQISIAPYQEWQWLYLYSGILAVYKDKFMQVGGFNETLKTWGAEDIEFGYRLSQKYKVKFDEEIRGIHLPHQRDQKANLKTNLINIYKLLSIYKNSYFEIPIKFNNFGQVDLILKEIIYLNKNKVTPTFNENSIDCDAIYIDFPQKILYKNNNNVEKLFLYGIALPFQNKTFKKAVISQNIFIYGPVFGSVIIQECLRVANIVKIKKTNFEASKFMLSKDGNSLLKSYAINNIIIPVNTSLKNYIIKENKKEFFIKNDIKNIEVKHI